MPYQIVFYNQQVQALIESWPAGIAASFVRITEQMATTGPNLGLPYTKPMSKLSQYKPVAFNPSTYAQKRRKSDAIFAVAYDALEDEFAALAALLEARASAGLTQAEVAARMGVSQPVVARIESSLSKNDHSPSLHTLRRYASACGMKLIIQMVAVNPAQTQPPAP
jgi:DNA-binding XRE family transcriptional regulator